MKKCAICFFTLFLIIFACGCTSETQKAKGYSDLNDQQQRIIDNVLNQYDTWKDCYDSGKNYRCSNISFFMEDGNLIFATCYRTSGIEKVGDGIYSTTNVLYKFFKVNLQSGKLSGHGYSIYDSMKENSAQIQAFSGIDFSETLNIAEKKNKIAEAYAETLNNN